MDQNDIKRFWKSKSLLLKLIIVNVAIFLIIRLVGIAAMIGGWSIDPVVDFLALPSSPGELAARPWTPLTYMFLHYDVFHILFNMLFLYWLGGIFLIRCTQRQLMALYLYCGLAGALAFVLAGLVFAGVGGILLGASASVMGIMVAAAVLMPDMEIGLLLIGRIKLKWVVCVTVAMFALGLVGDNAGGHVAHFGGMAMGAFFAVMLNRGHDITSGFNSAIDRTVNFLSSVFTGSAKGSSRAMPGFSTKGRKKRFWKGGSKERQSRSNANSNSGSAPKQPGQRFSGQSSTADDDRRELDKILDKIKQSGYTALTADERRRLFEVSSRIK